MKQKFLWLSLSIFPVFFLIFIIYEFLKTRLNPGHPELLDKLFLLLSAAALIMLTNLLIVQLIKPFYTGMVFMAWSMIKLMLIMGFFAFFILPLDIKISDTFVFILVILYLLYLGYELVFSLFLMNWKEKET